MSSNHLEIHSKDSRDVFGFWVYILTDCMIFASLFATYLVLNSPGSYGPTLKEHISLDYVLVETFALLISNFCFGVSVLQSYKNKIKATNLWLLLTFMFGVVFISLEINEFTELAHKGYIWSASGGASSFFTLVGTHGLHVSVGLLWILVAMLQIAVFGFNSEVRKRLVYLGLFWNFLDIVWIFIFSVVYLLGAI